MNPDQTLRSRRLFHLVQQGFSGYSKIENMIRNQIAAKGLHDSNGFELLRLIRREFSLFSRSEALHYRELVLRFAVKKPTVDGVVDALREVQTEIESYHHMLEASLVYRTLLDLRISEGDQFLLYLRNLPEKVAEHCQLVVGVNNVAHLWKAVTEYYMRSRASGSFEGKAHAVQNTPKGNKDCFNCGEPGHIAADCPKPKKCKHCGKTGHLSSDCWERFPEKRPSGDKSKKAAEKTKKDSSGTGKGRGRAKPQGRGKFKKDGKVREVDKEDSDDEEAEDETPEPESEQPQGGNMTMMVKAFSGLERPAACEGSVAGASSGSERTAASKSSGARASSGSERVAASESSVVHSFSPSVEHLVNSVGLGDAKAQWLIDSGATCHIVSEKWLKHYKVKFWYPGSAPILRGAGDHLLPTVGMVDLEFTVGKVPVTMKKVIVAGINLNVISCYALHEVGWETILGGARQGALVHESANCRFPLKMFERAWWLKVGLVGKGKRMDKQTKGPVPMDLGCVSSVETAKQRTEGTVMSNTVKPGEQIGSTDTVLRAKDAKETKVSTGAGPSEIPRVQVRSSRKKVGREETLVHPSSLHSFSYVCRMFFFGSHHVLERAASGDASFDVTSVGTEGFEPNTNETFEHDSEHEFESVISHEDGASLVSFCVADSLEESSGCRGVEPRDRQAASFVEVFHEVEDFRGHVVERQFVEGQVQGWDCTSKTVDVRMFRGFPQVEDLANEDDYSPSIAPRRSPRGEAGAGDVDMPSPVSDPSDLDVAGEPAPFCPEELEGPEGSDLEIPVPELEGSLLFEHECRGHWPYDKGCDSCVQARGRTPARRLREKGQSSCDLAGDIMFIGGKHWKILVLLMIQTGMVGMVVLGGDREADVKSTVSVLNEIGVGGLSLEVATDNEPYLTNLMHRALRESICRSFHWRNISENRPQAKGIERAVCIMKEGMFSTWLALESHCGVRLALESPLLGYLVGYTYRTYNVFCERKKGGTPLESLREKRGGQMPKSFPFGILGFVKPVHAQRWPGQRLVLCAYLGMRFSTGGGCLAYPVSVDGTGVREVIKGHSFRTREQAPHYDVNVLFPLLAGAFVDPRDREGDLALPRPPGLGGERAPPLPMPIPALTGGDVVPEGDQDLRSPEENEVPVDMDVDAGAGEGGVELAPEPMTLDQLESIDEGTEEKGDQWLDNLLYLTQADLWNEFCLKTSGSDVFSTKEGTTFSIHFGGLEVDVFVPEGIFDELTGHPLEHQQVVEGMRTEVKQVEHLKVGTNMVESEGRSKAKSHKVPILTARWVNVQKAPGLARCRLVVRDFASGAESAFRSGIYAPTSSLDSLRCVLAFSVVHSFHLLTADVSVAFMNAPVEEGAIDLVLLPPNMTHQGKRIVIWLAKAMNGLRRAPLLWFLELQRTVYSMGGTDTFESTLFRLEGSKGLVLILVYVDDLLVASQDQEEGEAFLKKLQDIWKIKLTGRIPSKKKGSLEFLGRTIYRENDGDDCLCFGVSRQYMEGIFVSWGEKLKVARETLLMPKLEDVHKDALKKFEGQTLTGAAEQRYRRVLGQLAWAALSRADMAFPTSFLARFQSKPDPAAEAAMRAFLKWLLTRLHYVQRMPAENPPEVTDEVTILGFCDASWSLTTVSGGIVIWQACCVKYFSRKQDVPALSSAEAEVVSIVEAAKEQVAIGMLIQTIQDGIPLDPLGMPLVTTGSLGLRL